MRTTFLMLAVGILTMGRHLPAQSGKDAAPLDAKAAEEAKVIAGAISKEMAYFESENFTFCAALTPDRMKPIKKTVEDVFADFKKEAGLKSIADLAPAERPMVILTPTKEDMDKYAQWFADNHPVADKKKFVEGKADARWWVSVTSRPVLVTHVKPNDDEMLRMTVAHLAGHYVVNRLGYNNAYVPGWLEEGYANYYEGKIAGKIACRCYFGDRDRKRPKSKHKITNRGDAVARYVAKIKGGFEGKDYQGLKELWKIALFDLAPEDAEAGYAVVSWMFATPGKVSAFTKALKKAWPADQSSNYIPAKGEAHEKALKETFDMTVDQADQAIRAFVKAWK